MGETREDRIKEFHILNKAAVLGLREGTLLVIDDDKATLKGIADARLFTRLAEKNFFFTKLWYSIIKETNLTNQYLSF